MSEVNRCLLISGNVHRTLGAQTWVLSKSNMSWRKVFSLYLLWMIDYGTEAKPETEIETEIGESIETILVWLLYYMKLNVFLIQ